MQWMQWQKLTNFQFHFAFICSTLVNFMNFFAIATNTWLKFKQDLKKWDPLKELRNDWRRSFIWYFYTILETQKRTYKEP